MKSSTEVNGNILVLFAANTAAPINPGSIPSVGSLTNNANRTSIGGGISPVNFSNSQSTVSLFLTILLLNAFN